MWVSPRQPQIVESSFIVLDVGNWDPLWLKPLHKESTAYYTRNILFYLLRHIMSYSIFFVAPAQNIIYIYVYIYIDMYTNLHT